MSAAGADEHLADGDALDRPCRGSRRRLSRPRPAEPASFTPPALPRPPTSTCALMTTRVGAGGEEPLRRGAGLGRRRARPPTRARAGPGRRAGTSRRLPGSSRAAAPRSETGRGPTAPAAADERGAAAEGWSAGTSRVGSRVAEQRPPSGSTAHAGRSAPTPIPRRAARSRSTPLESARAARRARASPQRSATSRTAPIKPGPGTAPRVRRDARGATAGASRPASSRSGSPRSSSTRSSRRSAGARCSASPYEVDGYLSPFFSPLIAPRRPADLVLAGDPHPVDPAGLPDDLLLLPEGLLPRRTSPTRRRAPSASRRSTGATRWRRPSRSSSRTSTACSCTSRSSRSSSCGSTRSCRSRYEGQWRLGLGSVDPVRQRRAAERLLAVLPLAPPPRRRHARLLLVHRADTRSATASGSG